jgi:hypothetical protein
MIVNGNVIVNVNDNVITYHSGVQGTLSSSLHNRASRAS